MIAFLQMVSRMSLWLVGGCNVIWLSDDGDDSDLYVNKNVDVSETMKQYRYVIYMIRIKDVKKSHN